MRTSFFLKAGIIVFTLLASQFAFAGQAGTVTFKTGDVTIMRADKTVVKAEKNVALNAGDTIETKDGRLQLSLIDGGKVSLQPNTIYKINKYEFSGKEDGTEYGFTELIKGGLRTVSGLIGHKNRDRYQLKTAVATIGIRGTEFTVNFNNNQLIMTTNHGSVDVCNSGGCLNATTGQSIGVAGPGEKPKPSDIPATASAPAPAAEETKVAAKDSEGSKSSDSKSDSTTSASADTTTSASADTATGSGASTAAEPATTVATNSTTGASDSSGSSGSGSSGSGSSGSGSSGSGSSGQGGTGTAPTINPSAILDTTGTPLTVKQSMVDGPGTVVSLAVDSCGCTRNSILTGDLKYEQTGSLKEAKNGGNTINPNKNNFVSFNSDGIVAWGQTTDAKYKVGAYDFNAMRYDYIAGATPVGSLARLTGSTYTVFASTAPFLVTYANPATATTIGAINLTGGRLLNFDFTANTFGYNITVPTTSYGTFNLNGTGSINGTSLSAGGTVTNNIATTCGTGCTGAFGSDLIQGSFLGANGERIGLQYGIYAPGLAGKVYGGAVLK